MLQIQKRIFYWFLQADGEPLPYMILNLSSSPTSKAPPNYNPLTYLECVVVYVGDWNPGVYNSFQFF